MIEVTLMALRRWAVDQGWMLLELAGQDDIYTYLTPGGDVVRVEMREDKVLHIKKEGAG